MDSVLKAAVCSSCLYWQTFKLQLLLCRNGEKCGKCIGKVQVKRANCHWKKEQILQSYKQRKTQKPGAKKKKRNRKETQSVLVHSSLPCFNQSEILIDGFSHSHGITGHLPVTFFSTFWLVPSVQGCGCFSTHTLGHTDSKHCAE